MKKILAGILALLLIGAFLTACGETPAAPGESDRPTDAAPDSTGTPRQTEEGTSTPEPLTLEAYEQILRDLGYDPQRVPEDDLDSAANFYVEEAKSVPNAASGIEAPGFDCQYFRFDGEIQARVYAEAILAGIDPNVYAVSTEEGPVWTRSVADGGEGEIYTLLLAGDVLLRFSSHNEDGAAAAEAVLRALGAHE